MQELFLCFISWFYLRIDIESLTNKIPTNVYQSKLPQLFALLLSCSKCTVEVSRIENTRMSRLVTVWKTPAVGLLIDPTKFDNVFSPTVPVVWNYMRRLVCGKWITLFKEEDLCMIEGHWVVTLVDRVNNSQLIKQTLLKTIIG
jgi:hypothetical protein